MPTPAPVPRGKRRESPPDPGARAAAAAFLRKNLSSASWSLMPRVVSTRSR